MRIFTAQGIEVQALQGLELRVERGEMVALVGASGSGKSTLLTILAGLDTPTAGSARVAGHDLVTMRGQERLEYQRGSVGFVWQQSGRNLLPYLSAAENIGMAHAVAGVVPRAQRSTVTDELLELLTVADVADRRPDQLSGGQKQRVAIAVALANGPRVLLADEPTGELDEATSADVLAAMETVNHERGVTTLIVTHDPAVSEHVNRTVRIRDGRTSTETLRSTHVDAEGRSVRIAEEYAVLDKRRAHAAARRVHRRPRAARSRAARRSNRTAWRCGRATGRCRNRRRATASIARPRARRRHDRRAARRGRDPGVQDARRRRDRRQRRRPRGGVGRARRHPRPVGVGQDDTADDARRPRPSDERPASSSTAATSRSTAATSPACWEHASHPCSRASG